MLLCRAAMAITHHRQLEAWQCSDRLRRRILELTSRERVKRDCDFCDQTRRAARSACRNLAEGFWKFSHPEFARYTNIVLGSLGELLDSADEALECSYVDRAEYDSLNTEIETAL